MKVKNVIKKAAELLGNEDDLLNYLNGVGEQGEKAAELILNCYNLIENELALDYLPLIKEETFSANNARIVDSSFSSSVVRIIEVRNAQGEKIPFRLFASYMSVDVSSVTVRYAYTPTEKSMSGECECAIGVSERLMAFGIASEYCAALGLYEEASVWDKKYKEGIEAAIAANAKAAEEAAVDDEEEEEEVKEPDGEIEEEPVKIVGVKERMPSRRWV